MAISAGEWCYSLDHDEPCRVVGIDALWGERTAQVWLARRDAVVRLHLDHLSRLAWAGAIILPAAPGFYHQPQSIEQLVDHLCAKILGCCGIAQDRIPAWDGGLGANP